jgi:hypothetical protein
MDFRELFKAAEKRYLEEYHPQFMSGAQYGEYYARGRQEGMAGALYPFWKTLCQKHRDEFSPMFVAFMAVWGEEYDLLRPETAEAD